MSRLPKRGTVFPLLLDALAAWFAAHADHPFHQGVGGRFFYHEAPRNTPMPYAVLDVPVCSPRDTLTERIDLVALQVVAYAATKAQAAILASHALSLFDGDPISGVGLKAFELERGEDIPPTKATDVTWQAGVQLSGLVETDQ